jgi:hypothetical protein
LVALTRPGRRWSHFASAIVDAVHDRSYTPPVF